MADQERARLTRRRVDSTQPCCRPRRRGPTPGRKDREVSLIWKPVFLALLAILGVAVLGSLLDVGFVYYQATRGVRLPFIPNLVPRVGSALG